MASFDERSFPNNLLVYKSGQKTLLNSDGLLAEEYATLLEPAIEKMVSMIMSSHSTEPTVRDDKSVYTGTTGVALLLVRLGRLHEALALVEPTLEELRCSYKDCTYLVGDCGPLATAALIYHKLGPQYRSKSDQCIKRILEMEQGVIESKSLPNEMLYGRAGYLYTLLMLQYEIGEAAVNKNTILNVAYSIITEGKKLQDIKKSPLSYAWHGKHYFGAAHGFVGIIYMLLKVSIKYPEFEADSVILPTLDYLMSLKFRSGNYPSSLESQDRDKLVHWCHGAPGFVYMFAAAYQKYGKNKFLDAVTDCTKVVWQRGLLTKGYGICHGVSGNAYTFLCAYNLTGNEKYLHRAVQFASWCCSYGTHCCRTPDRPFSLFEGMAGAAYFLNDILNPKMARFPAFEL